MRTWLYRLRRLRGKTVRLLPVQVVPVLAVTSAVDRNGDRRHAAPFAAGADLGYTGEFVTRLREPC
jgi:hypothetical protein